MTPLPDKTKVQEILAHVCERNGVAGLEYGVKVDWNSRFTCRMGDASFGRMTIRLSVRLFARATEKEQENTIAHEMAHIVAQHKFGIRIAPHGGEWQACMLRAGYEPSTCHEVDRTGLKRTYKTCKTFCGCGEHMVTPKKYEKIKRGVGHICRKCSVQLSITNPIIEVKQPEIKKNTKGEIVITSVNLRSK